MGRPSVFLRLALCNLACAWCDTKYTWDWQHFDPREQVLEMAAPDAENEITRPNCKHLVVTGGEPTLQQKQLIPLLKRLRDQGIGVEMETNGTVAPIPELALLVDHWNVSPKLESSGNPPSKREVSSAYAFFAALPSADFKYVVHDERDLAEVRGLVSKYNLESEKVFLMPQARDRETLLEKSRWLVEVCKREGYRFSTRLHVLLWGDARGV